MMVQQNELLQSFIDDLFALRQLRDGVFNLVQAPFDVNKAISDVCRSFSFQAEAKSIEIRQTRPDSYALIPGAQEVPSLLVGDERRFKQVLMNLMKNAMKFTQSGGIKIGAYYEGPPSYMLVIEVIDTGSGIAAENMAALFSRFGKLQRTADMNNEGIGLGLTIVKNIVESAGGKMEVFSQGVGKGSRFSFSMKMPTVVD